MFGKQNFPFSAPPVAHVMIAFISQKRLRMANAHMCVQLGKRQLKIFTGKVLAFSGCAINVF